MAEQLKPWLSFEEQLDLLQERGMHIENRFVANNHLKRVGYYRLSGYWYSFREYQNQQNHKEISSRKDNFQPNTDFEEIFKLYVFDKKLRLLALDALERIEMALRVDVAYILGQRGANAQELANCFNRSFTGKKYNKGKNIGKTEYQIWIQRYEEILKRAKRVPLVKHHLEKYGKLPIWASIEVWDFGLLSRAYPGMHYADQKEIAEKYQTS